MSKKLKGFTLVELLVAMAIIGVLIGLSLFGIAAAQRNSRDTARRAATQDINAGMADFFSQTGAFAQSITFNDEIAIITLQTGTPTSCASVSGSCVEVPLDGAAKTGESAITLGASNPAVGDTDVDSARWCFQPQSDGYSLAVVLESGEEFNQGTSNIDCVFP